MRFAGCVRGLAMAEPLCPCIYPDVDPDEETNPDGLCACGHQPEDEHDETGQCQIPRVIADSFVSGGSVFHRETRAERDARRARSE